MVERAFLSWHTACACERLDLSRWDAIMAWCIVVNGGTSWPNETLNYELKGFC